MKYTKQEVKNLLDEIFLKTFKMDLQKDPKPKDKCFLGREWRFESRDLLYLYFAVKNVFSIQIPQEEIAKGGFKTWDNIVTIICGQLERENRYIHNESGCD